MDDAMTAKWPRPAPTVVTTVQVTLLLLMQPHTLQILARDPLTVNYNLVCLRNYPSCAIYQGLGW